MTDDAEQTRLEEIARRLGDLEDLFRRRLLDDRDKRRLIDDLGRRVRDSEHGLFRQYLHPFINGIALVLDRLDRYSGPDREYVSSVRAELLEVMALQGVTEVPTRGPFDPSHHAAVETRQVTGFPPGTILEVSSCGLAHGSWIFRPARVVVSAPETPSGEAAPPSPEHADEA
ncbi:nucleotide exchange factor GrpE [Actinomadura rubrisoli]|uniref:Nucleotide exchange factor GrpE n=1 Tax=Actinomadura rubrisoli TaxID=2530368 RepID=A0A4R5BQZ0_9ACTN|nr:nucleotide exchange factor GrpE [Actinomadura rubrisoli]TDD86384.1 nucleotide exchange factor GrpE [Actinomadura rubrisoli]